MTVSCWDFSVGYREGNTLLQSGVAAIVRRVGTLDITIRFVIDGRPVVMIENLDGAVVTSVERQWRKTEVRDIE